jgi:adenylate kinase family enzyme
VQRIAIVGSSGSGKTWLATRLAAVLGLAHVELDAIHHGPGWAAASAEEMRAKLNLLCPASGGWVVDGNYESKGGDLVRERADTIIWLDLSRRVVMSQLVRRTARRALLRERLWNDNRESLREVLSLDPERSVILWSWTRHAQIHARYSAQADSRWVRLTSRIEIARLIEAASAEGSVLTPGHEGAHDLQRNS